MKASARVTTTTDAVKNALRELKNLPEFSDLTVEHDFYAKIMIPNYPHFIKRYYASLIEGDLIKLCKEAHIPFAFDFYNFGLQLSFNQSTELKLHDESMTMLEPIKKLIELFGVIIFKNVYLPESIRDENHFNNFAHLNFHRDRHDSHENRFSFYTRSPFVKEQYGPRTASTIFVDNAVAYLQAYIEGHITTGETGRRGKYEIFRNDNLQDLMGTLFLEQRWDAPDGYGEVCMIDNRSVLHSSYKRSNDHGYRIGARYLF